MIDPRRLLKLIDLKVRDPHEVVGVQVTAENGEDPTCHVKRNIAEGGIKMDAWEMRDGMWFKTSGNAGD